MKKLVSLLALAAMSVAADGYLEVLTVTSFQVEDYYQPFGNVKKKTETLAFNRNSYSESTTTTDYQSTSYYGSPCFIQVNVPANSVHRRDYWWVGGAPLSPPFGAGGGWIKEFYLNGVFQDACTSSFPVQTPGVTDTAGFRVEVPTFWHPAGAPQPGISLQYTDFETPFWVAQLSGSPSVLYDVRVGIRVKFFDTVGFAHKVRDWRDISPSSGMNQGWFQVEIPGVITFGGKPTTIAPGSDNTLEATWTTWGGQALNITPNFSSSTILKNANGARIIWCDFVYALQD